MTDLKLGTGGGNVDVNRIDTKSLWPIFTHWVNVLTRLHTYFRPFEPKTPGKWDKMMQATKQSNIIQEAWV